MASPDDDRLDRAELDRWSAPEPRPGFADAVMARLDAAAPVNAAPVPAARRSRGALAAAFALGAAAALLGMLALRGAGGGVRDGVTDPAGGRIETVARRTIAIGGRGVAVAEASTELSWQVERSGRAAVTQRRGRVFYRVDAGGPFRVTTPHGDVDVLGTCFTVAVEGASTRVVVHEGRVVVAGGGASLALEAGESATVGAAGPRRDDAAGAVASAPVAPGAPPPSLPAAPAERPDPLDPGDASLFETDPATLARWAEECRIRVDFPPVTDAPITDQELELFAGLVGLRPDERDELRAAIAALRERALPRLRQLYADATGDDSPPSSMDTNTMLHEILRTADLAEESEIRRTIARERAGLQPAPAAGARISPVEETVRALTTLGDEFEADVARVLGPARARELRRARRGWPGGEFHWVGCPGP